LFTIPDVPIQTSDYLYKDNNIPLEERLAYPVLLLQSTNPIHILESNWIGNHDHSMPRHTRFVHHDRGKWLRQMVKLLLDYRGAIHLFLYEKGA
jgi:hypothetical protein